MKPIAETADADDDDHGHTQTDEEILQDQIDSYVAEFDVNADVARRNVLVLEDIGPFVERTREAGSDVIAGMSLEHVPDLKIVVLTTRSNAKLEAALVDSPVEVEVREGASRTTDEALSILKMEKASIKEIKGYQGSWYDERTAELVIDVTTDFKERSVGTLDASDAIRSVSDRHGVDVRVDETPGVTELEGHANNVFGGDRLIDGAIPECTTGFVVKNSAGTRGFVTAAHCDDTMVIHPKNGTAFITATYAGGANTTNTDAQWHTTPRPEKPKFYVTDANQLRPLKGSVGRSSSIIGTLVCHMGRTTGRSCGQITTINHSPPASACGGQGTECDNVWIKVAGPNLECAGGDSGGPWFRGKKAYGIHKSGAHAVPNDCVFATFMSSTYLSNIGVSYVFA